MTSHFISKRRKWVGAAFALAFALATGCTDSHVRLGAPDASIYRPAAGAITACEAGLGHTRVQVFVPVDDDACLVFILPHSGAAAHEGALTVRTSGAIGFQSIRVAGVGCRALRVSGSLDATHEVEEPAGTIEVTHGPGWGRLVLAADVLVTIDGSELRRVIVDEQVVLALTTC